MKLISYFLHDEVKAGLLHNGFVYPLSLLDARLPQTMEDFLLQWEKHIDITQSYSDKIIKGSFEKSTFAIRLEDVKLQAPVPHPGSCRDGYAFRQHVAAARRNRGVEMIEAFNAYPVFYFTNHRTIQGPGKVYCQADHFQKLDFELEAAIVICKEGINILAEDADSYIGGLMIMNDLSARTLQMEEMMLNLGPAKGKDFATCTGPWLVTLDELTSFEVPPKKDHIGKSWNLAMTCAVNSQSVSSGNLGDMDWTFAEIIERASYGVKLYPGDIIGSGTAGTGCFLELNGTGKFNDKDYKEQWLQPGDTIDMQIQELGILNNTVEKSGDYSILNKKKHVH